MRLIRNLVLCSVMGAAVGGAGVHYTHKQAEEVSYAPPQNRSDIYTASAGFVYTIPNGITLEIISAPTILSTGSLTLPAMAADGQPLTIEAPKGMVAVVLNPNVGQAVSGINITAMTAGVPYRLKYSTKTSTWYAN